MSSSKPDSNIETFLLLILSSPSGAGKTTLCNRLRERFPSLRFSVSHTTRPPRPNEQDGREYHFVSRDSFLQSVGDDAFAEWAHVHGNFYGTSRAEIDKARNQGGGLLFDVDYQGARQIRARFPEAITVFILPPSLDELERRLRNRASDDESSIQRRLSAALKEIEHYGFFDYLVVNNDLDIAAERLASILTAERCRRHRQAATAEQMLRASTNRT